MNAAFLRTALALGLVVAMAGCRHAQPEARVPAIDWHTSPLDLDLRGMNGKSYRFRCPPGKPEPASVTGSGVYTDASSICAAAAHAGAIDDQSGGQVTIEILPGRAGYPGSMHNFIQSVAYPHAWNGSFVVLSAADSGEKPKANAADR